MDWVPKLWNPNNIFQVLIFQLYFNKKYIGVVINDFTMHLIISKAERRQKRRQNRKTMRRKDVKAKEEIVCETVFIYVKHNGS